MYRKVPLSSFHNGKVEYFTTSGSGDTEENASAISFYSDFLLFVLLLYIFHALQDGIH